MIGWLLGQRCAADVLALDGMGERGGLRFGKGRHWAPKNGSKTYLTCESQC